MYDDCGPVYAVISDIFHTPITTLSPKTRIVEDLRIDGEDAEILFNEIEERFGTDLRNLRQSWSIFFRSEREVQFSQVDRLGVIMLVVLIVMAVYMASSRDHNALMSFGGVLFRAPRQAICISDIAHAIKIGFWPRHPVRSN